MQGGVLAGDAWDGLARQQNAGRTKAPGYLSAAALSQELEELKAEAQQDLHLAHHPDDLACAYASECEEVRRLKASMEEERSRRQKLQGDVEVLRMQRAECRTAFRLGSKVDTLRQELDEEKTMSERLRTELISAEVEAASASSAFAEVASLRSELNSVKAANRSASETPSVSMQGHHSRKATPTVVACAGRPTGGGGWEGDVGYAAMAARRASNRQLMVSTTSHSPHCKGNSAGEIPEESF
eukprot:gnl/TRDRNA2_/TRDRNA2_125511_c0_seq1.p1 gnl/TRDRNA2_/TRDRNA2_125511_c0~~gnl/TRDRNA2_/TRDRNA2_125511_c0_seq1.p1  ORF type:complete len:242 (+),score=45.21 gnl/TRDRNA2_/TRDRNA2_125511_c0_seq1:178-903(+)